jgi:hypothetical protein
MSTDIVVRIPRDLIDFEQLEVVADALAMFTGERVEACEFMEVRTASPRAAAAMKALLHPCCCGNGRVRPSKDIAAEAMPEKEPTKRGPYKKREPKTASQPASNGGNGSGRRHGEIRAWAVFQPGETEPFMKITRSEKDRLLEQGEFDPGMIVHQAKVGRLVVVGAKGSAQHLAQQTLAQTTGG